MPIVGRMRRAGQEAEAEARKHLARLHRRLVVISDIDGCSPRRPREVEADHTRRQPELVVVGALEQHQAVDEVRYEQADDAGVIRWKARRRWPPSRASRTATASRSTSASGYATETSPPAVESEW